MTNEITYYDTDYTFINPVRYFKANDPYYFEVDNIPIKQLEESNNFLKDQVDGILAKGQEPDAAVEIDRSGFSELKPYAVGNDRKVRVKPGRYTSRINNAYTLTPLQVVEQVFGFGNFNTSATNTWRTQTNKGSYVSDVLAEFTQGLAGNTLNMNGLFERSFVWPIDTEDGLSLADPDLLNVTTPVGYGDSFAPDDRPLYPNVIGALIKNTTEDFTRDIALLKNIFGGGDTFGGQQGRAESEFIKRWRGAIRTSVVDVPSELDIEIPEFKEEDFFYTDENGNQVTVGSNTRIDLLFIYSKAVDEESTTIPKYDSLGNPTHLVAPALGILKGAGIGVSRQTSTNNNLADDRVSLQDLDGVPLMAANPGDQTGSHVGFTTSAAGVIRGSFPSPDDLLNLAPVLSENLESTSYALIGQTILPLAYILVEKDDPLVAGGELITVNSILDIRPFFRTTELAYNERAGLAAATPQVSIANPVVTEAHLERVKAEIYTDLRSAPATATSSVENPPPEPRTTGIIAAGVITGGFNWGPEGALVRQRNVANTSLEDLRQSVVDEFGYYPNAVEFAPLWDKANWFTNTSQYPGNGACDYINVGDTTLVRHGNPDAGNLPPWNGTAKAQVVLNNQTFNGNLGNMGWSKNVAYGDGNIAWNNTGFKHNQMFYVSKRINIVNNPHVNYHVNVNYLNCIPVTDLGMIGHKRVSQHRQPTGIWVVKHPNYFIINVAFPNDGLYMRSTPWNYSSHYGDGHGNGGMGKPWIRRFNAKEFSSFMLPAFDAGTNSTNSEYNEYLSIQQDDRLNNYPSDTEALARRNDADAGLTAAEKAYPWSTYNAITPILYPSVSFEVVGLSNDVYERAMGDAANETTLGNRDGHSYIVFDPT